MKFVFVCLLVSLLVLVVAQGRSLDDSFESVDFEDGSAENRSFEELADFDLPQPELRLADRHGRGRHGSRRPRTSTAAAGR
ncbi:unnamed protein product [Darwinula stevensoni]|uniref:Uncharacterized protein n=1 Tax=Darwinula stevensoni TaxID=69355 RepID=A0A7R9ACJ7_9CRUS|nr:unnamed protein product [Darwinula stevensoni]CAG0900171.1 unnamed protein product [Darwinula stevensoni]